MARPCAATAHPDAIGAPYYIAVDFETLEADRAMIRDRDTVQQVRMSMRGVATYVKTLSELEGLLE